jgi:uncharacterized protein (DUF362 family)/Pyruvate/2-oxoacid:ferredoxin oxidoreductase delta subunit
MGFMSRVIVRNADYHSLPNIIDDIFEDLQVDIGDKRVLLKPNFGAAVVAEKSASTDARVVKAILDSCLRQSQNVIIGDNPGNLDTRAMDSVKMSGILDLAGDYYYNISKEGEFVDIGSEILPSVFISKVLKEVDYVINIPKMKTHVLSGISCSIKNLYGYVVGAMKSRYHLETKSLKRLTQLWLDLYKYKKPNVNIVDAIIAMEGGGPTHGIPRKVGKIVAGENGMEVDVVLTAMMGWDPRNIKKLEMAHQQGLGEIDLNKIKLIGDFEILPQFKRPPTYALDPKRKQTFEDIAGIQPTLNEEKCSNCLLCGDESCPAGAISFDPYPIIDRDKCISCYCCVEFCPEGALTVEYNRDISETV